MAVTILKNSSSRAVVKCVATQTLTLAELNLAGEANTVGLDITSIVWSGTWTVARGATTVLSLSGTGSWDLSDKGMVISDGYSANVVFTLSGSGTIIAEVSKRKV